MSEDYYKTLGISRNASQDEIQKAYRSMARKYHPDLHPDDEEAKKRFQEVQHAYDVLSDQKKREMYDRYGSSFESMGAGGGPQSGPFQWGAGGPQGETVDFSQFFGDRFGADPSMGGGGFADFFSQFTGGGRAKTAGGRRASRRARKGADIKHEIQVPFNSVVVGGKAQVTVRRSSGKNETIEINIPPGIESGKKIRLRGQGEEGLHGGKSGDILLTVHVSDHPYFQRQGAKNLLLRLPITLEEAILGAKIDVPTPKGTVSLQIPKGTSGGQKLRVKGHGVQAKDSPGDLLVETRIVLSKEIDPSVTAAMEVVAKKFPTPNPRTDIRW
ncbi:MAG: J domain-containing protein [Planctomycetia bacterium]|jgi:DnaJ-class molecular chaperone